MVIKQMQWFKGTVLVCPFYFFSIYILIAQDLSDQIMWKDAMAIGLAVPKDISHGPQGEFAVFLQDKSTPLLGKWKEEGHSVSFFPAVPFTFGLTYELQLDGKTIGLFSLPVPAELPPPEVLEIYPTSKVVPENMLKIHIRFSEPMQKGQAINYVQLMNAQGEMVPEVFLDLQPELWNADQTMLTLWLDPGRIKRDLQPNLKMGAPLIEGNSYKLVVSDAWKDQQGIKLKEPFVKAFVVAEADRQRPDIHQWQISYPPVNSRETIKINFGKTLDATLVESAIQLFRIGKPVPGKIILSDSETGCIFQPEISWQPGEYQLIVETRLEDLAGNNLNRLFDRDLHNNDEFSSEEKHIKISFSLPAVLDP